MKDILQTENKRYQRQIILEQIGVDGQQKIKDSKVLVIGAGGLGAPVLLYLAAAGVGTIGVMDFDNVDISNLQRQIIYTEQDIGKSKVETVKKRLYAINSTIKINCIEDRLDKNNAEHIISKYDIIVDASDNFQTRYLISDTCAELDKIEIYGAVFEFSGQVTVFGKGGPCLRCLNPVQPPENQEKSFKDTGIIGPVPGLIGAIQATEVIKTILECKTTLKNRMIFIDLLTMKFDEIEILKNDKCPICHKGAKDE